MAQALKRKEDREIKAKYPRKRKDFLLVAAIDFGTTYSGFAFLTKDDYESNPLSVFAMTWTNPAFQSLKTSTTILFDPDKKFNSFGFEAESKYAEKVTGNENQQWYYFKSFKMLLYENKGITTDMILRDATGKEMNALEVFSGAIHYLKNSLEKMSRKQNATIKQNDIRWVLTVPAIWNDRAKFFMREAANLAGIPNDQLEIALEPEAASLYCLEWMKRSTSQTIEIMEKFIVVDAGGGTIDFAVHRLKSNTEVEEVHQANGGDWGGTKVDLTFKDLIIDIISNCAFTEFKSKYNGDFIDFFRGFEVAKRRNFETEAHGKVPIWLPSIVNELCEKHNNGKGIQEIISGNNLLSNKIQVNRDKLMIDMTFFKGLFEKTLKAIIDHMSGLVNESRKIKVFLVGGFGTCHLLHAAIAKHFPNFDVITPTDPVLAVVKGAAVFGHRPETFFARISVYTYGIETTEPFKKNQHSPERKITIGGVPHCDKIFCIHVKEGEAVILGKSEAKTYKTIDPNQTGMDFNIYASKKKNPKYTNEPGCFRVGKLKVDLSKFTSCKDKSREVKLELIYGGTELEAVAEDLKTGLISRENFKLGSKTRKIAQVKT